MTEQEYTPTTEEVREAFFLDSQDRCRLPFGKCDHGKEFDRWLAERDRQVAERAWDEGYDSGFDRGIWGDQPRANPYRKEATGE